MHVAIQDHYIFLANPLKEGLKNYLLSVLDVWAYIGLQIETTFFRDLDFFCFFYQGLENIVKVSELVFHYLCILAIFAFHMMSIRRVILTIEKLVKFYSGIISWNIFHFTHLIPLDAVVWVLGIATEPSKMGLEYLPFSLSPTSPCAGAVCIENSIFSCIYLAWKVKLWDRMNSMILQSLHIFCLCFCSLSLDNAYPPCTLVSKSIWFFNCFIIHAARFFWEADGSIQNLWRFKKHWWSSLDIQNSQKDQFVP